VLRVPSKMIKDPGVIIEDFENKNQISTDPTMVAVLMLVRPRAVHMVMNS
jgi:hypothetical protein